MDHATAKEQQLHQRRMRLALGLARKGYGMASPNPMVGALVVLGGKIIGRGWHHRAGEPHGEIEALADARRRGLSTRGATLYVTLEPCSTHGRTPPCTEAIAAAGIKRIIVGTTDPNPLHSGRGFEILRERGIQLTIGVLAEECAELNEAFNHWIVHETPFVTVKAAMTVDGKIATASGDSKWITGEKARAHGMKLREGVDAVVVGIKTVLADNPSLTVRLPGRIHVKRTPRLRRIILDSLARTPLNAKVIRDEQAFLTTLFVSEAASKSRVAALAQAVKVVRTPLRRGSTSELDISWILKRLGSEQVTSVLVEGGGEVNGSFLLEGLANRVAFFYAPKLLGGRTARHGVAGAGVGSVDASIRLANIKWRRLGADLLLSARVAAR
jgi:diaminohydroxyphosphoribosylaminopyrimidine deaminase / 5-amino-6-(5-phosphoribosylamino)uracil reductase